MKVSSKNLNSRANGVLNIRGESDIGGLRAVSVSHQSAGRLPISGCAAPESTDRYQSGSPSDYRGDYPSRPLETIPPNAVHRDRDAQATGSDTEPARQYIGSAG